MAAYDGRFRSGPLAGQTVNVKWYLKHESVLDMTNSDALSYYLVLTDPPVTAASIKEKPRPWLIEFVYLFDARRLLDDLRNSDVQNRYRHERAKEAVERSRDLSQLLALSLAYLVWRTEGIAPALCATRVTAVPAR